jgi:DNA polymerase-3 subunit gamma/tau
MSYVVLARKWRPQLFEDVIGQEHVARTLTNAIQQDRVAHAFLFCGPRGVGKTSTARILAKALNCKTGPTTTPCYQCASCDEVSRGASVDVLEIDGASNRGVGEIRELREGVHYAASRDRYKIYIIDEVHMLTTEAFNALLKTLEEPPAHVKFIFATTEPHKIPVTILSRCQRFDFKRIPIRKIVGLLEKITKSEGIDVEPAALSLIARQADGGGRDALSLMDQVVSFTSGTVSGAEVAEILGVASRELLFRLSAALLARDVETALNLLDDVHNDGHDMQQFAAAVVGHLRDLTVVRVTEGKGDITDLTDEELGLAQGQTQAVDPSVLHRAFHLMVNAADEMRQSTCPKLLFEMVLVKMASIEPLVPMELILARLEALESGALIGGGGPQGGAAGTGGSAPPTEPKPPPTQQAVPVTAAPTVREEEGGEDVRRSGAVGKDNGRAESMSGSGVEPQVSSSLPETLHSGRAESTSGPGVEPQVSSSLPETLSIGQDTEDALPQESAAPSPTGPVLIPGMQAESEVIPGTGTSVEPPPVDGAVLSNDEAREAWRSITRELCNGAGLARGWCLHAEIDEIRAGHVRITFPEDRRFLVDPSHETAVAAAAQKSLAHIWDGAWSAKITVSQSATTHAARTLDKEANEVAHHKRETARESIAQHAAIAAAQRVFSPKQVRIVLDDKDDLYSWDQPL